MLAMPRLAPLKILLTESHNIGFSACCPGEKSILELLIEGNTRRRGLLGRFQLFASFKLLALPKRILSLPLGPGSMIVLWMALAMGGTIHTIGEGIIRSLVRLMIAPIPILPISIDLVPFVLKSPCINGGSLMPGSIGAIRSESSFGTGSNGGLERIDPRQ